MVHARLRDPGCPSNNLVLNIVERSRTFTEATNRLAQNITQVKTIRARLDEALEPANYQVYLTQTKDLHFEGAMGPTDELLS